MKVNPSPACQVSTSPLRFFDRPSPVSTADCFFGWGPAQSGLVFVCGYIFLVLNILVVTTEPFDRYSLTINKPVWLAISSTLCPVMVKYSVFITVAEASSGSLTDEGTCTSPASAMVLLNAPVEAIIRLPEKEFGDNPALIRT